MQQALQNPLALYPLAFEVHHTCSKSSLALPYHFIIHNEY